jgi:hypothetical protein
MPTSPIVQLQLALAVAVVMLALWKGGAPERLTALLVAVNMTAGLALDIAFPAAGSGLRFATDGLTALAMLAVTIRWATPWMGAVMLFFAAQFSLHAYYMVVGRDERDYLHALVNNINFTGVTLCLALGAIVAWRRRVRSRPAPAGPSSPARHP